MNGPGYIECCSRTAAGGGVTHMAGEPKKKAFAGSSCTLNTLMTVQIQQIDKFPLAFSFRKSESASGRESASESESDREGGKREREKEYEHFLIIRYSRFHGVVIAVTGVAMLPSASSTSMALADDVPSPFHWVFGGSTGSSRPSR